MSCVIYNGQKYSYDEFANLLLDGELEKLSLEKKVSTSISELGKEFASAIAKINAKYDRKLQIEKAKYEKALTSSPDMVRLRKFLKKDLAKNSKLSESETARQAGLTGTATANELKNRLAIINKAWKNTKDKLEAEKQLEINIAQDKPVKAKDVFNLRRVLKNMFGLRKLFTTKSGAKISEDEAAATIMDRVLDTIAKRQNVTKESIYNSTFYKRSRMEEINNSLETLKQLLAFHGSPHLFDRFTTDKMGTGEGNQAFGWGLYFTDIESIARTYADKLSDYKVYIPEKYYKALRDNFDYKSGGVARPLEEAMSSKSSVETGLDNAIINLEISVGRLGDNKSEIAQRRRDDLILLKELKQLGIDIKKDRTIYKVSLHQGKTPDQYTWLEWDKPLTNEQRNLVIKAIENKTFITRTAFGDPLETVDRLDTKGKDVYKSLENEYGAKEASLMLLKAGIDGIKYPAESIARGTTSDTARGFNYVVFDENAITIEDTIKFQLVSAKRASTLPSYNESDIIIDFAGNKRYEISDVNATFLDDISSPERIKELVKKLEKGTTLEKVLFHEELFRAYPELMKLPIAMKSFTDNRNRGFYNANSFVFDKSSHIILNNKSITGEPITSISDTFATLIHEIQHAIQHIESFNMGTSEDTFIQYAKDDTVGTTLLLSIAEKSKSTNTPFKDLITPEDQLILDGSMIVVTDVNAIADKQLIKSLKDHLSKLKQLSKGDIRTMYLNSIGEIEARITEARAHFDEEDMKLFRYKNMMQNLANERNAPVFNDDIDAYFTVISNKTIKQPVLFQEPLKKELINALNNPITAKEILPNSYLTLNGLPIPATNLSEYQQKLFIAYVERDFLNTQTPFTQVIDTVIKKLQEDANLLSGTLSDTIQELVDFIKDNKNELFLSSDFSYTTSPEILNQQAQAAYQSSGAYSVGNAKFEILTEGEDIIHAITSPNVSSPLHEIAHKFEKYLTPEERQAVLEFANSTEWTTETSETFARGFEKFLSEGKAPSPELQNIFEAFASWLMAIYNGIVGSDIDIELNDKMRSIYSAMMGSEFISETIKEEVFAPVEVVVETPVQEETPITPTQPPTATLDIVPQPEEGFSKIQLSEMLQGEYESRIQDEDADYIIMDIISGPGIKFKTYNGSTVYYLASEENPSFPGFATDLQDVERAIDEGNTNNDATANSLMEQYKAMQSKTEEPAPKKTFDEEYDEDLNMRMGLTDAIYNAKQELSNGNIPFEEGVEKVRLAQKAYDDYINRRDQGKAVSRILSMYSDEIEDAVNKEGENYEFYKEYQKDIRYAIIADLQSSIDIMEEDPEAFKRNDINVEESIARDKRDIEILKKDLEENPPVVKETPLPQDAVIVDTTHVVSKDFTTNQLSNGLKELFIGQTSEEATTTSILNDLFGRGDVVAEPVMDDMYIYYLKEEVESPNFVIDGQDASKDLAIELLKESMTPSAVEPQPEDLIEDMPVEVSMVETPVAIEEFKEEEKKPITEVNGYKIGDRININGNPHKVRGFSKVGESYYVSASAIIFSPTNSIGTDTSKANLFPMTSVSDFIQPTFKTSTLKADERDYQATPKAKDIVLYKDKKYIVSSVKPDGTLILKSINVASTYSVLDDGDNIQIIDAEGNPLYEGFDTKDEAETYLQTMKDKKPEYSFVNSTDVTVVEVADVNKNRLSKNVLPKERALKNIAFRLQEMFPSIPYKIVDFPDQEWSARFHKGTVELNLSKATTSDVIHEYLHPFIYTLKVSNPELYANLINELKTEQGDFYKNTLKEISKLPEYSSLSKDQLEDEVIVRWITNNLKDVIDTETGLVVEEKYDGLILKNLVFLRRMLEAIMELVSSFFTIQQPKTLNEKSRTLLKIAGVEYNPIKGSLKVLGADGKTWAVGTIGKPSVETFMFGPFIEKVKERVPLITKQELADLVTEINETLLANKETLGKDKFEFDFKNSKTFEKYSTATPEATVDLTGLVEADADMVLKSFSLNTTLDELSTWFITNQKYKLNMDKHKESFEQMSDLYAIKNKTELENFANSFKSKLKNLEHTIEKRLRATKLTPEVKERIVSNMTDIKTLMANLTDENSVETTVNVLRVGFTSLNLAESLMQSIRTRINYGDINKYIDALVKNLKEQGVRVEFKPDNRYGIRLNKGVVEINREQMVSDGWIPMDIGRYMVGDYKKKTKFEKSIEADKQEAFRKQVQGINTSTINNLKAELSPAEIEELNWDIAMLRNFYATYDSFTNSLLKQYADKFEYQTEYIPFSQSIADAVTRHKELEADMRKLSVEWLFPYFDKLQNDALSKVSEDVRKEKYVDKEAFSKLIKNAAKDNSSLDFLFGTMVNTEDPINATVSILISDVINKNTNALGHLVSLTKSLRESYFKDKGITTSKQRAEYIRDNFLRKVRVYEIQRDTYGNIIKDEKTNEPLFNLVERWGFNEEYNMDEYDIARKEFIEKLAKPVPPPMGATNAEWVEYQELAVERTDKIKKWEKDNLEKFKNKDYERLMKDPMYKFLYNNYKSSNDLFGEAKLKYGIIQQGVIHKELAEQAKENVFALKGVFDRIKDKNTSSWTKTKGFIKTGINYFIGMERELMSEQENPDGTTYKAIQTSYLRMLKEDVLDFDLTHTITGFTEDALRYNSLRGIQANVENLRMLVNGGKNIDGRKVPQLDANGSVIWHSMISKVKSKNQLENRLNKQLNYFIDRVFYGEKQKQVDFTLWGSRRYKENLTLLKKMIADKKTPEEIYQATTFYLDDDNRWKTDDYANLNVNLNNLANKFTFYTSVNSLAFNVMSTTRNLTIGNFVNLSEGNGNKYYSKKQYAEAVVIYTKNLPQNAIDSVQNTKSKLNQVLFDYQAIQGEFRDRYNRLTSDKSLIARLFSTDSLFFLQHVAEHQIQGTATLALMLNTTVKLKDGTTTNLWDAFDIDENGVVTKDKIDPSSFDETKFIRDLHEMNRSNHGNYSDLHKTAIQREWYGSLLMTFRKHMYPTLKARWGNSRMDYSKGTVVEGFHKTFFRKITEDLVEYGANITSYDVFAKDKLAKGWTEEEIYSFRRATFETFIGVIGMMLLTLLLAVEGDDDDKLSIGVKRSLDRTIDGLNPAKKWLIATANGLYTDIAVTNPLGIYNPFVNQSEIFQEFKKISTNPVAVQFTFKKMADFIGAVVDGKDAETIQTKFEKIVPVYRHLEAFSDPEAYVDGYLQYQSLVGTGLKKGAQ